MPRPPIVIPESEWSPIKRRCPRCGETKSISLFSGIKRKDGYCRVCKSAMQREKYVDREDHNITERFWKYVNKDAPGDCWLWTHTKTHRYGMIWYRGKLARAHLVSMDLHGIPRPTWPMVVDHICKQTKCVNPAHLRVVHQTDNAGIYADRSRVTEKRRATIAAKKAARQPNLALND